MKIRIALCLFFFVFKIIAQEKILITENDEISLFETYLSLNSEGNIFPAVYGEGLIYASNHKSSFYKLYFSDLKSKSTKFKIGSKYNLGAVATFENEIYFTGTSKNADSKGDYNFTIYKGILSDFKVKDVVQLQVCNLDFSFTYPTISKEDYEYIFNHAEITHCFLSDQELLEKAVAIQKNVSTLKDIYSFDEIALPFDLLR